ncbi:MAG: hypothetical protein OFPII_43030 [Osedax symbiont Rs1]|nr:MAG: hypothetical protein OFPII_43030 [Osedax symbiont Rs1]
MRNIDWIAVDWGTTRLRVWGLSKQGEILTHNSSDKGMNTLQSEEYEQVLIEHIEDWLDKDRTIAVLACGMLGSKQGWIETHYETAPCIGSKQLVQAPVSNQGFKVYICPGVKQLSPADIMRGEETQILGFLTDNPGYSGVICLPGTHCKWVQVTAGVIEYFQTYMTGELYALLSQHSILRHCVAKNGWHTSAFKKAVASAIDSPATIYGQLFSLRAESILNGLSAEVARARLSGYMIGLELCAAQQYWKDKEVMVIGEQQISIRYMEAFRSLKIKSEHFNSDELTIKGLTSIYHQILGQ